MKPSSVYEARRRVADALEQAEQALEDAEEMADPVASAALDDVRRAILRYTAHVSRMMLAESRA